MSENQSPALHPVIANAVGNPDGGLHNISGYLSWTPGDEEACLDGDFTADELRAIAEWMDAHQPNPNK